MSLMAIYERFMHTDGSQYLLLLPLGNDSVTLKLQNPRAAGEEALRWLHSACVGSAAAAERPRGSCAQRLVRSTGVYGEEAAGLAADRGAALRAGSCCSGEELESGDDALLFVRGSICRP